MPLAMFWTAVSGHETPAAKDLGGTLLNPKIPWEVAGIVLVAGRMDCRG